MKYQCVYKSPGVCEVVMHDGKTIALDFNSTGGPYILEAILEVVYAKGQQDGFATAREMVCKPSEVAA